MINNNSKSTSKFGNEQNDISIETGENLDDSVVAEESQNELIKKLREKLKNCEAERQEYLTGWQRTKADFINLRKRDEDEKESFTKYANLGLITDMLSVLDSFEHAQKEKSESGEWRKGVESTILQLHKILSKYGVSKIDQTGVEFDTNIHEAVGTTPVSSTSLDHKVSEVLQTGYKLGDRVIRPARVRIGEYKE